MAKIASEFAFTGSLGNLSAYKMRGVDRIVIRTKGGASKKKIKTSPAFENTRRINAEFGGRASASKWIMQALWPQKAMADYNIAGPLNALMKHIQALPSQYAWGQRPVNLSKNPKLLEGFSLNRQTAFDSVLRTSLSYSLSRENRSAHIVVPELLPGINFYTSQKHPMYRIVAVLGIIPDLSYTDHGYQPLANGYETIAATCTKSEWYPVLGGSPSFTLNMNINTPPDEAHSLMLSIGICFGTMKETTVIQQVKYAGCAKVLAMA